jgi:hypothetical protein
MGQIIWHTHRTSPNLAKPGTIWCSWRNIQFSSPMLPRRIAIRFGLLLEEKLHMALKCVGQIARLERMRNSFFLHSAFFILRFLMYNNLKHNSMVGY